MVHVLKLTWPVGAFVHTELRCFEFWTMAKHSDGVFNDAIDWVGTRRSIVVHRRPWASLSVLQQ